MKAYADTSFLISLYTPDVHSTAAATRMARAKTILFLTPFGEAELTNALELRLFRREIDRAEAKAALVAFEQDVRNGVFSLQPMAAAVCQRAKQLSRKHTAALGVRTLDVLHVAAALVLQAEAFYTFDTQQGKLAQAEGLRVK